MREGGGGGGEEEGGLAGSQAGRHTGLLRRSNVAILIEREYQYDLRVTILRIVRHSMHQRQREVGKNVGTDIDGARFGNDDGGRGCRHACPLIFFAASSARRSRGRQTDEAGRPADDGRADGRTGPEGEGGGHVYCFNCTV